MKWALRAIPYGFVLLFALVQARLSQFDGNAIYTEGARLPNEATGEVWEIAFRDGGVRYATLHDYAMYFAPFVIVPAFIAAILWIIVDLWRSGFFAEMTP
ncbi:hypothetical protein GC173_12240 [bacterium]|nr:hypothetical protein [bacterium]